MVAPQMSVKRLTLAFDDHDVELDYVDAWTRSMTRAVRIGLSLFLCANMLGFATDLLWVGERADPRLTWLRAINFAILGFPLFVSYLRWGLKHLRDVVLVTVLLGVGFLFLLSQVVPVEYARGIGPTITWGFVAVCMLFQIGFMRNILVLVVGTVAFYAVNAVVGLRGIELGRSALIFELTALTCLAASYMNERRDRRLFVDERLLADERAKSERLLRNMLPEKIAERLKQEPAAIAESFDAVTVLFADIVGFTPLSVSMDPRRLVHLLNEVFSAFDAIAQRHGLEKIKTIGDAYMVVGGLPEPRSDHARAVASMALELQQSIAELAEGRLQLRIGMDSGPVVAGVIGSSKYTYDLWGDTVNTASRMESHGAAGAIHVSERCRAALGDAFDAEDRGVMEIKGKGPMRTFWLKRHALCA